MVSTVDFESISLSSNLGGTAMLNLNLKPLTNLNLSKIGKVALALAHSDKCPNCVLASDTFPFDSLQKDYPELSLYYIDYDVEQELCDIIFEIPQVPMYVFFYEGKQLGTMWGLQEPVTVLGFAWANLERVKRKEKKKLEDQDRSLFLKTSFQA